MCVHINLFKVMIPVTLLIHNRIITSSEVTGFNNFYRNSDQKADTLHLEVGEDYLLVAEFKESGGADYLQVSYNTISRMLNCILTVGAQSLIQSKELLPSLFSLGGISVMIVCNCCHNKKSQSRNFSKLSKIFRTQLGQAWLKGMKITDVEQTHSSQVLMHLFIAYNDYSLQYLGLIIN